MTAATINGQLVERASVVIPRSGPWAAEVRVMSGEELNGAATLVINGLTLSGTILEDGGVFRSRGWYRVVAGANGWRKTLPERAYRNEAGVKASTILADLARECGETFAELPASTDRVGPAFIRPEAEASFALHRLRLEWYVDESGVTRLGARAASSVSLPYLVMDVAPDIRRVTLAADNVSEILPGATLEGIEAATVRHDLTPKGLRTHVFGVRTFGAVRSAGDMLSSLLSIFRGELRRATVFLGRYEYRVDDATATHCDVTPVRRATGLPSIANVPMRTGTPGCSGTPIVGSSVEVQFLDGDGARPVIVGYEGPDGDDHAPGELSLQSDGRVLIGGSEVANPLALGRFLRSGDTLQFSGAGPMVPGSPYTVTTPSGTMSTAGSS